MRLLRMNQTSATSPATTKFTADVGKLGPTQRKKARSHLGDGRKLHHQLSIALRYRRSFRTSPNCTELESGFLKMTKPLVAFVRRCCSWRAPQLAMRTLSTDGTQRPTCSQLRHVTRESQPSPTQPPALTHKIPFTEATHTPQ
jgi:hypothetical protein